MPDREDSGPDRPQPIAAQRVYVIGAWGSGKTTLARQIGRRTGLPVHELDLIHWIDHSTNRLRPVEERDAIVGEIVGSGRWVAEGLHADWTTALLDVADAIIWLDHVGWPRVMLRLIKRSAGRVIGDVRRPRGWRRFLNLRSYGRRARNLTMLLLATRSYHRAATDAGVAVSFGLPRVSRTQTVDLLARYEHKLIHCRTSGDIEAALERLSPIGQAPECEPEPAALW